MLAISSGGLYRPGMTLFQSDVAWWWLSPDCMFFLWVCSITRFGLFVWLGCFTSPRLDWSTWPPWGVWITGGIGGLRQSAPTPPARFLGASLLIPAPWGGALHWESSMASFTARFRPPWFGQGVFFTLFAVLQLKEMLGLS